MADQVDPPDTSPAPPADAPVSGAPPAPDSEAPPTPPAAGPRHRRPSYQPTLLPPRRRRLRVPRWLAIPLTVLILAAVYVLVVLRHGQRRFVATAGKIVYASDAGSPGVPHVWIADADGGRARRLTGGPSADTDPVFSPDGSQVLFLSTRGGAQAQVFIVDADGQNLVQATRSTGTKSQAALAPSDPTLLGFLADGKWSTTDLNTGDTDVLLPPASATSSPQAADTGQAQAAAAATVSAWSWAPAAERSKQAVAAVLDSASAGQQVAVILPTLAGKPQPLVFRTPAGPSPAVADTLSVAWSPDGALMAVAILGARIGGQAVSAMGLFNAQGTYVKPLIPPTPATTGPQDPVFSPDGSQLLFEVWHQPDLASRTRQGLFAMPSDGSGLPHLVYKGDASRARFLPGGDSLLFLAARPGGGHDLCRVGLDGTGFRRLSGGGADVSAVAVSPQAPRT